MCLSGDSVSPRLACTATQPQACQAAWQEQPQPYAGPISKAGQLQPQPGSLNQRLIPGTSRYASHQRH